jgi:hypothetical protein
MKSALMNELLCFVFLSHDNGSCVNHVEEDVRTSGLLLSQEDVFAVQKMVLKPESWEGKSSVAAYVAHAYGASVFDSNGANLSCFFHATAAASWAWLGRRQDAEVLKQRVRDVLMAPWWLEGGEQARTWLRSMCQGTRGVDAVDAADVARSCSDMAANRSVSEAGAAVVAAVFGVPVAVLVVNRSRAVQCECAVQLRVYHPQGSAQTGALDLDKGLNLLLDSGSSHWMAVEYPAWLRMHGVRQAEDGLGLGSSSFALVPPTTFREFVHLQA